MGESGGVKQVNAMETTRKIFSLVVAFLLLFVCLPQAVLAEECLLGTPDLMISDPGYYAVGYDFAAVGTPPGVEFYLTNIGDAPYAGYTTWYFISPTEGNDIVLMTGFITLAPGQTIRIVIADYLDEFAESGEYSMEFGVMDTAPEVCDENNKGIFEFSVAPAIDVDAGAGLWYHTKFLLVDSSIPGTPGIMNPEGPISYIVTFNGEQIFKGDSSEDYFVLDIRDNLIVGENFYAVEAWKEGVYDPYLENNIEEGSFYLQEGSIAQDVGVGTCYDSDTLTVFPVPAPEEDPFLAEHPYVPSFFQVRISTGLGEEILKSTFDISQGCRIEDFSDLLSPGDNEVIVEISYADNSPFYDSNLENNKETFSVLVPATCVGVSGIEVEKGISQKGTIYVGLEGNSAIAERVVVEAYDKKGKIICSGDFYDLELPCKVSMISDEYSFRWSDIAGGCIVKAYIPGEEMEDI